ncbi:hypothetical protein [Alicycliphilus denitrificans]|uniref:Uncharacterized protein n=1 Tax=Alicycliphilus denitrificans TaxID=179636 RepID=A0A3R7EBK1_9BURK|nr:hypothetical protein [Alicycliphilus denitrificans]RKJ94540.1 hypothetical protein CE154_019695 [Alicycliphilus denitrificans]
MALTMTRNRTQATLTKLVQKLAEVHDELVFAQTLHDKAEHGDSRGARASRITDLHNQRDALYATLVQFDSKIVPQTVGTLDSWRKPYGGSRNLTRLVTRYLQALHVTED